LGRRISYIACNANEEGHLSKSSFKVLSKVLNGEFVIPGRMNLSKKESCEISTIDLCNIPNNVWKYYVRIFKEVITLDISADIGRKVEGISNSNLRKDFWREVCKDLTRLETITVFLPKFSVNFGYW
jgi:hypothetical protein